MAAKKVTTDTNKKQKPEEQALQVLYVDSEENLTAVRERLEHTSAHSIALVIPSQTQLHSPVAWRLLYRYTREMGKDVSVVSSDPQVRAIAQSAQFKVASSLR